MFPQTRKRARPARTQREAILSNIYEDNLQLRTSGFCASQSVRQEKRRKRLRATAPVMLVVAMGAFYELTHYEPVQAVASIHGQAGVRSTVDIKAAHANAEAGVRFPIELSNVITAEHGRSHLAAREAAFLRNGLDRDSDSTEQLTVRELFGLSVKTIVIDAGHGGHDPGAIGKLSGIREKDVTLDIALRVRSKLARNSEYRILLVRDSDTFLPLKERAEYANSQKTDLFVSIHVNYMPGTVSNAIETYYFGHYQDSQSRTLAQRENKNSSYAISEFEHLLKGIQDSVKLHESKQLAKAIQASLLGNIRQKDENVLDTGVKAAPFAVLLGVKAPSVLAEIGNLSSHDAERNLGDPGYRDAVAEYLSSGITQYLKNQPQEAGEHHVKVEDARK